MNEEERLRQAMARRKAETRAALERLGAPTDRPLLELLTPADLLTTPRARLEELADDYVNRRNADLGRPLIAKVERVDAGPQGLEVTLAWRNLQERGRQLVHLADGPERTRCGLLARHNVGELHPTERAATCSRCAR